MKPRILPSRKADSWRLLLYYNLYRLLLACSMAGLALLARSHHSTFAFQAVPDLPILGLLCISLVTFAGIFRKILSLSQFVQISFALDILLLGIILLSGHFQVPTLIALHVSIAVVAIAIRPYLSVIYAMVCALIILIPSYQSTSDVIAGQSSFSFFLVTTIVVYIAAGALGYVGRKAFINMAKLDQQNNSSGVLDTISKLAVDKLDVGVAVLDDTLNIRQINDAAKAMIGNLITNDRVGGELAKHLIKVVNENKPAQLTTNAADKLLSVNVFPLNDSIFLTVENKTDAAERLRETKLPSVGRTALSIAHEIRNPLNAINHAAQLLTPDDDTARQQSVLLGKIRQSAQKIDEMVESVLIQSRAGLVEPREIELKQWMRGFTENFKKARQDRNIHFDVSGDPVTIIFDYIQFEKMVSTLCENSIEHTTSVNSDVEIQIVTGIDGLRNPYLEIWDYGRPLNAKEKENLFEPFQQNGSGVDFYLVKEICDANGATIEYQSDAGRSGFCVSFHKLV